MLGRLAAEEGARGRLQAREVSRLDALAVELAVGDEAPDRDPAEVDPVVGLQAPDQARPAALPPAETAAPQRPAAEIVTLDRFRKR